MPDTPPPAGMTISVGTRRDVVIVDHDKFLAAAHPALRDLDPEFTEAQAADALTDVTDAASRYVLGMRLLVGTVGFEPTTPRL